MLEKHPAKKTNSYCTYGDMFYELLDVGYDPRAINYNELASDWIKRNVLKEFDLDCLQIEWLKKTISYFCINAKAIWKKHRGRVIGLNVQRKHKNFFGKFIYAAILSPCNCSKCYLPEPSGMKKTPSNSCKDDNSK